MIRGLRPDEMGPLRPREKQNGSGDLILRQLGWRDFEGGARNQEEVLRVCAKFRCLCPKSGIWSGWSWDVASGVCPCPCRQSSARRGAFDRQRLSNLGPTNPPDGVSIPAGCKSRRELLDVHRDHWKMDHRKMSRPHPEDRGAISALEDCRVGMISCSAPMPSRGGDSCA
jgi:hypothetical protein